MKKDQLPEPKPARYDLLAGTKYADQPLTQPNTADDVVAIAYEALTPLWAPDSTPNIYWADNYYVCPDVDEALTIINRSKARRLDWIAEEFDCDDFSILLKADFSLCSYYHRQRMGGGYAFGIVWFERPAHAMNFMINNDAVLRFVEPRTGNCYTVDQIRKVGLSDISLVAI